MHELSDWEYFNEPSEFEMMIMDLKEKLKESIRTEHQEEMNRLREENSSLQEVKINFKQIKEEYADKERALKREKDELLRNVRRERITELLKDFEVTTYRATSYRKLGEKCDKCDANRKVAFFSPSGQKHFENCICGAGTVAYKPEENRCSSFEQRDGKLSVWYKAYRDADGYEYSSSNYARVIYSDGMEYEHLERHHTYFRTEEECQLYCDWLAAKEDKANE